MAVHPSSDVDESAQVAGSASIWHLAQVRDNAIVGDGCVIGRGAYVGSGVELGANCKVQNAAMLYEPATLAAGVFIGPGVILTNDHFPRAVSPDGSLKSADDWNHVGVTCEEGSSVGAGAVCVAPVTIGRWSMVAAGSTVIKDVPAFALVAGTPARQIGWVGRSGRRLETRPGGFMFCPSTGVRYIEDEGQLRECT